jgi:nucleoside-diphosphate-sugar epimerase
MTHHTARKSAVVLGSNGIVGSNMLALLENTTDWRLHGIARSHTVESERVHRIAVDLLDVKSSSRIAAIGEVDYVFFAALAVRPTPLEQVAPNLAMLRNAIEPILAASPGLSHICIVHGTKWYGSHLGPYRTPARETDERDAGPNFYYDQRDWLAERQRGQAWSFSTLRPHLISGFNIGNPNNMIAAIGAYAAVKRELGDDLDFPGTQACYESLSMATDVSLLNEAMLWAATTPKCANQDYNIINGDYFRWKNVWPSIAAALGMRLGRVSDCRLSDYMADKGPVWDRIVQRHGLRRIPFEHLVSWNWADFMFRGDWDDMSSTVKARRDGFTPCIDTEEDILAVLARYRAAAVFP